MGRRKKHQRYLWADSENANEASRRTIAREKKGGPDMSVWPWNQGDSVPVKASPVTQYPLVNAYAPKPECIHDGKEPVFALTIANAQFTFAGAKGMQLIQDGGPPSNTILIIDLAGQADLKPPKPVYNPWFKSGPASFATLEPPKPADPVPRDIPILRLDWQDQHAPPSQIGPAWWKSFLATLAATYPQGGHVIVCCIGSHGRTGTALTAIALAGNKALSLAEAAQTTRETHCQRTIESGSQWKYLSLFRPTEELPEWIMDEMEPAPVQGYIGKLGWGG